MLPLSRPLRPALRAAALSLFLVWPAAAQEPANTSCPVLPDEAALAEHVLEHEGVLVGFCCTRCKRLFGEDPEAYRGELEGILPPPASSTRPIVLGDVIVQPEPAQPAAPAAEPGVLDALGRLHPLAVHFPIGLLLAAALAELLVARGRPGLETVVRYCWTLGTAGAVASAGLGLAASQSAPALGPELWNHRALGLSVALLAVVGAVLERHSPCGERKRWRWRAVLALAVVAVVLAGHTGGSLVFGPNHLIVP